MATRSKLFDEDHDKYHASPVEPSLWELPRADRNGVLACDAAA